MPLHMEQIIELGRDAIAETFDLAQLRLDQVTAVLGESDWTLVIKLHTLVEAAVTQLLVAHTDPALHHVLKHLPLSDSNAGKVRMARDLGLLSPSQFGFIQRFSTLRNRLAHNIEHMEFALADHVGQMDKNQRRVWREDMNWTAPGSTARVDNDSLTDHPKTDLYLAVFRLLAVLAVSETMKKSSDKAYTVSAELEKQLFPRRIDR
ncbi:hypothetical protein ACIZ1P_06365 [Pseudomonas guariconensis]|uniref:hypothetical protein n=1 Tax=Pseudomonas guariconensis TaxID=1288410 RepID=UPI003F692C2F